VFSTGNANGDGEPPAPAAGTRRVDMVPDDDITELFYAVIEATEEAIVNALLAADTMTGRDGNTAHRLDPDRLVEIMRRYGSSPPSLPG
jgi:D-aminopeptidase